MHPVLKGAWDFRSVLNREGADRMADVLAHSRDIQLDAARVGFDWPDVEGALAKLREEVDELSVAVSAQDIGAIESELGDVLFSAVNVSRFVDINATRSLGTANERFQARFASMTSSLADRGRRIEECTLDELDEVWDAAKRLVERNGKSQTA